MFPGELDTDPAPVPRGVRGFAGPPEMVDAVVETLRTMKPTPVEEPQVEEPEEKPETEEQALARMSRENEQKLAAIKRDLNSYARRHGVESSKPAVDPARVEAQRLADAQKLVVEAALEKKKQKREAKARQKILKGLR